MALVVREVGWEKAKAAEILGVSKRTLYRWEKPLAAGDSLSSSATD